MGCGKSYLTDDELIKDEIVYFGIDKMDHLIHNSKLKTKENVYLINEIVDYENFNKIYEDQIKLKLSENKYLIKKDIEIKQENELLNNDNTNNHKIMLFGLHACGNLTSDSLKIFARNKVLTHLVMVGCCFNLLTEYISKETIDTKTYQDYINSIGYNNKGGYLESTLMYDWDFRKVGYPLSSHIRENYKDKFLGRAIRNIAMQNIPKEKDYDINSSKNYKYKNLLFRTMLQCFFEVHFPELKYIYGYDKLKLEIEDSFSFYVKNFLLRLEEMINDGELNIKGVSNDSLNEKVKNLLKRIKYIPEENKSENKDDLIITSKDNEEDKKKDLKEEDEKIDLEEFYDYYKNHENILWAFFTLRVKFIKIVEYIVAIDRILYLFENGIHKIQLVKIFDGNRSPRNLLIYASKD